MKSHIAVLPVCAMAFVLWFAHPGIALGHGKYDVPESERERIREEASAAVAEATGVPVDIFRALIGGVGKITGESTGRPGAVRWCTEWVTRPDGLLTCPNDRKANGKRRQATCYTKCDRAEVWNNRLDTGLWQLRDAPSKVKGVSVKGWSWVRWFEQENYDVPKYCALDPGCATEIMISVVRYLQTRKPKIKCTKPIYVESLQWLGLWNGCGTYRIRVEYWLSQGGKPEDILQGEQP